MHAKIIKNIFEKLTKMVPKWSQNLSKIDPGWGSSGHLGAILETRCFQDLIFDDVGSILGPPLDQFGVILGIFFLMLGFGLHLGSQNTSKMRPKRGSKS